MATYLVPKFLRHHKVAIRSYLCKQGVQGHVQIRLVACIHNVVDDASPCCARLPPVVRRIGKRANLPVCRSVENVGIFVVGEQAAGNRCRGAADGGY